MQNVGKRGVTWKIPDVTADGLKIFACIAMLVQSIGITIIEKGMIHLDQYTQAELSQALGEDSHLMVLAGIGSVLQLVGGLAVPIFAFLLVEGFRRTSSYRKYLISVFLVALLSEIPYDLANSQKWIDWTSQNALVSMSICLLMLYFLRVFDGGRGVFYGIAKFVIILCAVIWVSMLRAQAGLCMVLLTAVFYLFYKRIVLKTVLGIVISLLYITAPLSFYGIGCYNEKRKDKISKYVYYAFYPLHLLVLGVIGKYLLL